MRDRREAIYEDDEDRVAYLSVLAAVVERYDWICHAFCTSKRERQYPKKRSFWGIG